MAPDIGHRFAEVAYQRNKRPAVAYGFSWCALVGVSVVLCGLFSACALDTTPGMPSAVTAPPVALPQRYMEAGLSAYTRGDMERAAFLWLQAAAFYDEAGKPYEQSVALTRLAQAYQALGHTRKAMHSFQAALTAAKQSEDQAQIAVALGHLGAVAMEMGSVTQALQYVTKALDIARALDHAALTADILNTRGNLLFSQNTLDDALEAYKACVALAKTTANHALAANALTNAARVSLLQEQPREAQTLLDAALTQMQYVTSSHDKAYALLTIGLTYTDLVTALPEARAALLQRASQTFNDGVEVARALGDKRALSYAWGYLAKLAEAARRPQEALRLTRQAVFAAQEVGAPESLYLWQWQTGRLLEALHQQDDAIAAYRRAVQTLESIRQEMTLGYGQTQSFRTRARPVYLGLIDLLLRRAAAFPERTQSVPVLQEARETVESFAVAELQDYFQDDCVQAALAKKQPFDDVAQTAVIVYPIPLPDRTELLVSLPNGKEHGPTQLKRFSVPVNADTLIEEVRQFRLTLEKRTSWQFLPHAQKLYEWLIRPLESELASRRQYPLVFVPDGPLRTIPMAALHDGQEFLIHKYALATTPGLSLVDPRPLKRDKTKTLALGLTESVQGFPPLPYVATELQVIGHLYTSDIMLNEAFRVPAVEQELRGEQFNIVHIGSHGHFEKDVEKSFILTFDDKLTLNRLKELVEPFKLRVEDRIELLTLSACQTAVDDDRAALGLAGVAIQAGARSALATLWSINDQASSALVAEFYRQLQGASVSRAVALQQAQLYLASDLRYEHPFYWASFLLISDWL